MTLVLQRKYPLFWQPRTRSATTTVLHRPTGTARMNLPIPMYWGMTLTVNISGAGRCAIPSRFLLRRTKPPERQFHYPVGQLMLVCAARILLNPKTLWTASTPSALSASASQKTGRLTTSIMATPSASRLLPRATDFLSITSIRERTASSPGRDAVIISTT